MAIDSKNLLVWVKAMSRGQALPLDASEIYDSLAAAQTYAASATAYAGQTIKAKLDDGKYHSYVLQPSEAGYVLEEVGAVNESDLKQYVQVVSALPESGQIEGVIYIVHGAQSTVADVGYIWAQNQSGTYEWKKVFTDVSGNLMNMGQRITLLEGKVDKKAPIENPVFSGTVKIDEDEVAVKSYVDGLIANLTSDVPGVLTAESYAALIETEVKAGQMFRVAEYETYWDNVCEPGDLIIVLKDHVVEVDEPSESVMVVQANVDGAVTSTADAATVGEIVVFNAVTGKVIKGSGVQIASLNDAIAKAHEHANKDVLDSYDKTQSELLAAAKTEAEGLVSAHESAVNTALEGKADKATTLAGYGIEDAYNKTEVDNLLSPITENLNSKISGAEVDTKISTAKEETLEAAAAAAAEALESRVGAIPADTTIQAYIDTAVGSGGTASAQAIATAKQQAIDTSKTYTDERVAAALTIVEF